MLSKAFSLEHKRMARILVCFFKKNSYRLFLSCPSLKVYNDALFAFYTHSPKPPIPKENSWKIYYTTHFSYAELSESQSQAYHIDLRNSISVFIINSLGM